MYKIIDLETGKTIETSYSPKWVRQQRQIDCPIKADSYEEADGVTVNINGTKKNVGIAGRGMDNYTPLVTVEEISGEPYIMQQLAAMQAQVKAMQQQSTTTGEQVAEMYAVQAGDVVVKSELDAAYREGVNSYE